MVEVADVAHHGAALQRGQHVPVADVHVAGGGDHEVGLRQQLAVDALGRAVVAAVEVGRHHFEAVHAGLHRADRVDLGDAHDHAFLAQRLRRALAHVAVTDHQRVLAGEQVVGAALDRVAQAVAAAVLVVVLRLRHRVVHVHRGDLQRAVLQHFLQPQHAGGGLLGDAVHVREQLGVALVQDAGEVAAVVEDHVHGPRLAVLQDGLLDAPVVLFLGLALPRVDGDARRGDRRSGVVLRRENVARGPAHLGAELDQRLDQHRGLDRHVQAADDPRALQRLAVAVARADRHQRRHLALGDRDLASSPAGQRHVGDLVVGESFLCGGHVTVPLGSWRFFGISGGTSGRGPQGCSGTVRRRDAALEPTGMYSRRVGEQPCGPRPRLAGTTFATSRPVQSAFASIAALSVRSQVKSASSRPKWP